MMPSHLRERLGIAPSSILGFGTFSFAFCLTCPDSLSPVALPFLPLIAFLPAVSSSFNQQPHCLVGLSIVTIANRRHILH
ncbi:hypothetical protein LY78DRAFT_90955 [Colletotrichum sublineola]|nr:hypothetical protein LY78DRAFT_90955 [Colletotrichum sublineola]